MKFAKRRKVPSHTFDAVIIGAGHNGLVAAAYLARAGLSVAVFERRDVVGGAAVSEHPWPGWTVSTAAYVCSLLHPEIVRDLDLASYGYDAYLKDPSSFTPLPDGRSLLLSRDDEKNANEIAAFDPSDVAGFFAFEREVKRLGEIVYDQMLADTPSLEQIDPASREPLLGSAAQLTEGFVRTPVLQATLATDGIIGTNAGPRDAGTGYVLAHHYAGRALGSQGAWGYVRGGMGAISQAAADSARAAGARIQTEAPIDAILVEGGRAAGVALAGGSEIAADAVLSNADPKSTFLGLVPQNALETDFWGRVRAWSSIGVSLKVNLALGELPNFAARPGREAGPHHRATIHIAPSIDYLQAAFEDASAGGVSRSPMLECFMQTITDPSLAPRGKHLLSIFAQYYPYNRADGPWTSALAEAAAESIVAALAQYAPNLPAVIEARQILSPLDIERRFGMSGGQIFHGELMPGQIFEKRFTARTPLKGLYLCGSGAHPGGCVSGVPGMRAARALLADLARSKINVAVDL